MRRERRRNLSGGIFRVRTLTSEHGSTLVSVAVWRVIKSVKVSDSGRRATVALAARALAVTTTDRARRWRTRRRRTRYTRRRRWWCSAITVHRNRSKCISCLVVVEGVMDRTARKSSLIRPNQIAHPVEWITVLITHLRWTSFHSTLKRVNTRSGPTASHRIRLNHNPAYCCISDVSDVLPRRDWLYTGQSARVESHLFEWNPWTERLGCEIDDPKFAVTSKNSSR